MSDSYGSGLDLGPGSMPSYAAAPDDAATVTGSQDAAPASLAPQPAPAARGQSPSFGSSLRSILPGPNYTQPDPQMSPLDQSADLLQQRVSRASSIATNPLLQIFAPEAVQAARQFVPQATEQLQKIQQQKAGIQAGRVQAQTLGLDPGEVSDYSTAEDRLNVATGKALRGDMRAFQGIAAVAPEKAAAIAPQVHEVMAGHLDNAQLAFDSLSGMQNQGQYAAKLDELRQNGTLTDLEALGLKVPPSFDAFNNVKAAGGLALRNARIAINSTRQQLEDRNTYQPMAKDEAATYTGRLTTAYGDQITNGTWSANKASGTRGFVNNGLATPDALGQGGVLGNSDQRKEIRDAFGNAVSKQDMEKYRAFNRTYQLATTDAKGNAIPEGKINTNPNVQQSVSEGLASMLRGGQGGANVGLLKIELGKRGWSQSAIDGLVTNYAGVVNTLFSNANKPYLSQQTQKQIRDVMDVLKTYNDSNVDDRALQIARRAGALGFTASDIGFGEKEATGAIGGAIEEGRQAQIARMRPNFQAIGYGDGVIQLGAQRPGAGQAPLPPGTAPANQLPGARPLLTPVQQAQQPPQPPGGPAGSATPAPTASQPSGPQPAGTHVTIAGAQVTPPQLPAGASPSYMQVAQRIESGNERNPWTAGASGSSASGAFQFIQSTWAQNKPPGAPDDPKQATPQQQVQAFANLTAKNADALRSSGVEVNDQNLYMAHNLGAGGAASMLKAPLNADARSIVGEAAARNNPLFFRGRPTVATVLSRYQQQVSQDISDVVPRRAAPAAATTSPAGNPMDDPAALAWQQLTPEQQAQGRQGAKNIAADIAPAAASTVGAIGGGVLGGVPGAMAGGAAGGAAGQALRDYLKGNQQDPIKIAEQAALGGVLGVASPARPLLATAGRVVGSGAIEAGAEAAKNGASPDMIDAGVRGAAEGLGGEMFGRALGMAGHKVYSMFAPDAKAAVQAAAATYSEASQTLRTEAPKITTATGSTPNPKYADAEVAKTRAETTLKDAGLNPEEAAYAHKVSSEGVPLREAQVSRPGAAEQRDIGQGYQQLESEVSARGVGAPKATPKLPDGPIAAVEANKVSAQHAELAQHVEAAITAPAPDWQTKWTQLKDARSDLLQAERDALTSTATGRTKTAADMRTLADTVRTQQAKVAQYVFGPTEAPTFMERLRTLDTRYRNLMEATNGGDLAKAASLKGEAGRSADRKFRAFAYDDPVALQAWASMRKAGPDVEKDVKNLVAVERIPVLGKLYSAAKLASSFNSWMRERTAGNPAKFEDFINIGNGARTARDFGGTVMQRGAVQGDVLNSGQ